MTDDTSAALVLTPEERYIAHLERMSGGMLTWRTVPTVPTAPTMPPRYAVYWRRQTTVFYSVAPTIFDALTRVVDLLVSAGQLAPQDR